MILPRRLALLVVAAVACSSPPQAGPPSAPPAAAPPAAAPADPDADRAAIRAVFASYLAKGAAGDFAGAGALIDQETLTYYQSLLRDAVELRRDALEARPIEDQVVVILLRHGETAAALRQMTVEDFMREGLDFKTGDRLTLGTITLDGDRATAPPRYDGVERDVGVTFAFHREPAGWRLNFVAATQWSVASIIAGRAPDQVRAWLAKQFDTDVDGLYALPK